MADEATERVARALHAELGRIFVRARGPYDEVMIAAIRDALLTHAREARRLALEEAAQIAEWGGKRLVEQERDAARAEVERLKEQLNANCLQRDALQIENERLRAEIGRYVMANNRQAEDLARVRGALEQIIQPSYKSLYADIIEEHRTIARAALEGRG